MVPSCGCCNSGRVYNGHIMVALNETDSELGLRRAARGCRVTASCPQGGTSIAAGEVGCPGAAARSRCLGTGFRGVGAINGFGLSPNALNINGANTYQFVGSDPGSRTDAQGRFWGWLSSVGNAFVNGAATAGGAAEYVGSGVTALAENPSALGAGTLQGLANVANGVQNTAIGMANIPADVANGVGYLTAGDSTVIPVIPSPDWSNNLVVQNNPAHGISTFLGGQAATTLATLGLSQLGTAGEAANLAHLTDPVTEEAIGQSGALTGKAGICALSNPTDNSWIDSILTGVPNAEGSVPISDAAASTFTPIPAAGPVSGCGSLAGGHFSPYASLDLATGAGQMSSLWSQASPHLKDMGASSTMNLILQELTNINTQTQNLTSKCKQ